MSTQKGQDMQQEASATTSQQSGNPRRRGGKRDAKRIKEFSQKKINQLESWADQAIMTETNEAEFARKTQQANQPTQPPKQTVKVSKSTKETPPMDEPMYTGPCTGTKPVRNVYCSNNDHAGFMLLVEATYSELSASDVAFSRRVPFASYAHYCNELFWAHIINNSITQNEDDRFTSFGNPSELIKSDEMYIPDVIRDYLAANSTNHTVTGDKVYSNLPSIAVPQSFIPAIQAGEDIEAVDAVESGSFGIPSASTHNAYEAYPSPLVTRAYIQELIDVSDGKKPMGKWNPFPQLGRDYVVNKNMLGYYDSCRLHYETIERLRAYTFQRCTKTRDTMLGRLRHSAELMSDVSLELRRKANDRNMPFRISPGLSAPKPSISRLVTNISGHDADVQSIVREETYRMVANMAGGATTMNKAYYFAFRRERLEEAPGTCYLVDDLPPVGWTASRNDNLKMTGPYCAFRGRSYQRLFNYDFEEITSGGSVKSDLLAWLSIHMRRST